MFACTVSPVGPDEPGATSSSGGTFEPDGGASSSSSGGTDEVDAEIDAEVDAAVDAAGGATDLRIDPIELGRSWTYDVTELGFYPLCPSGAHVSRVTGSRALAGKTAFSVESLCTGLGPFEYAVEGDRVFAYDDSSGTWLLSLDAPVEAGHAWSDGTRDFIWEDAGTVTVAAETFEDCWSATEDVEHASFTLFCRGVGPVHWHYEDGFGNGYDAKLTATTR